ncbi:hypothetical protein BSL82_04280 [Tardibacter chloracetimidivorans]|uniref:EthD domain-containing protein n=2 Tax=Tardibacter chloracetimidivorans TaxID=1921510 RepID=A0A1L3ZSM2_9SPHN|nr:hypothetical protein BSL82_04280 [Tardibacter chloracetimidivorans]
MIRLIGLLTKKSGMNYADFVDYYEHRHVPLINRIFPGFSAYSRNYVLPNGQVEGGHIEDTPAAPDFNVVTSLWFSDRAALQAALRALDQPDIRSAIIEDENNFIERDRTITFFVDEYATPDANLRGAPKGQTGEKMTKMVVMLNRNPTITVDQMRDYYEGHHSVLAAKYLSMLASYHRNYVISDGSLDTGALESARRPEFDAITEIWFRKQEDIQEMIDTLSEPVAAKLFADDEEKILDRSRIQRFMVDERVTPAADIGRGG